MYEVFMHDGRASAVPSDQEDEDLRVDISQIAPDRRRAWGRGGAGDVARAACPATVTCRGPALRKRPAVSGSGVGREDERAGTTADASIGGAMSSKPGERGIPGTQARRCVP